MAGQDDDSPSELSTIELDIMSAALSVAEQFGIAKLSMSDVAKAAGLSRQTLYRYFSSKEDLVRAVVEQETGLLIIRVLAAVEQAETSEQATELAFSTALRTAQEHQLLQRLLQTEPESLLPALTSPTSGLQAKISEVISQVTEAFQPDLDASGRAVFSDVAARLLISYVISPPAESAESTAQSLAMLLNGTTISTTNS